MILVLMFIPIVYHVVKHEFQTSILSKDILGICEWAYLRAKVAFDLLKVHKILPGTLPGDTSQDEWLKVHICYGFHYIWVAKGRNDVFSAIITQWQKASKVVVYNFTCALQQYCMSYEPDFFKDTQFAINIFHSSKHKCGEACFLSTYCIDNPELLNLNSSVAKCRNSRISKIHKAVSYVTQDRAVMYMQVFFLIWNRQQIQKMEGKIVKYNIYRYCNWHKFCTLQTFIVL